MGPFWTMRALPDSSDNIMRLRKLDTPKSLDFKLRLLKGHLGPDDKDGEVTLSS